MGELRFGGASIVVVACHLHVVYLCTIQVLFQKDLT